MGKTKDTLVGFAVGDAMGVPIEFTEREKLLEKPVTNMIGHGTYDLEAGTWSDDTSLTIATMDSITKCDSINYNDMASRFCDWMNNSEYTATGITFDIGTTTKRALSKFADNDIDAVKCGSTGFDENGNGSLMRMLPIALYCHSNKLKNIEVYDIVKKASSITHANDISVLGCFIYVNYMLFILNGKDKYASYNMLKLLDYDEFFDEDTIAYYNRLLKTNISHLRVEDLKSTGYVVHTLEAVIWITLNCESYAESVVGAINLGDDTDTIGAITGSISGALYGYDDIPEKWLAKLKRLDYIEQIAEDFEKVID